MTLENNKDGAPDSDVSSSSSDINSRNSIDAVAENFTNMTVLDDNDTTTLSACDNCGKGEDNGNSLKFCGACKLVKYCSAACQKAHRPQHKKECKQRAAEIYDEKLFKEVERAECPICLLTLPMDPTNVIFKSCCGKTICTGCDYAMCTSEGGSDLCPFCRKPTQSSDEEQIKRLHNLMDKGNGYGFYQLAGYYARGILGLPQDDAKANELLLKAGELGCSNAYCNLGFSFYNGRGVERDMKKAKHYYELSAMGGFMPARHNLGRMEWNAGNHHLAMRHFTISARAGDKESLDPVKRGFMAGIVTKDEYANTLRVYHERQKEMKSDAREQAALARESLGYGH